MTSSHVYCVNTVCNPAFHKLAPGREVDDDPRFDVLMSYVRADLRLSSSIVAAPHLARGGSFAGFPICRSCE